MKGEQPLLNDQFEQLVYQRPLALDAKLRRLTPDELNHLDKVGQQGLAQDVKGMAELAVDILAQLGYQMAIGPKGEIAWRRVAPVTQMQRREG